MNNWIIPIFSSYVLVSLWLMVRWSVFVKKKQPSTSPEDTFIFLVVSIAIITFWPLPIPIHCFQVLKNRQLETATLLPAALGVFAFGISIYLIMY